MGVGLRLNKRWSTRAAMVAMKKRPTKDRLCFLLLASMIAIRFFSPCSGPSCANHCWKGCGMGPDTHITNCKSFVLIALYGMVSAANWLHSPCADLTRGPTGRHRQAKRTTTWSRSAAQIQHFNCGVWFSFVSCFRAGRARANL